MDEIMINRTYVSLVRTGSYSGDNTESFTPYQRDSMILTGHFCNILGDMFSPDEIVLPQNTRFVKPVADGGTILVIEETPRIRTISVNLDMVSTVENLRATGKLEEYGYKNWLEENKPPYYFQLAFPYIVYITYISRHLEHMSTHVFFRLHPISSFSDYLLMANLLNISSGQSVCLGEFKKIERKANSSILDVVDGMLERFWVNTFNKDYIDNYNKYQGRLEVGDFLTWQYNTLKDPMFIYAAEWLPWKKVLGTMIRNLERESEGSDTNFNRIISVFKRPDEIKEEKKRKKEKMFKNLTGEIVLKGAILSVGDMVKYKNENCYVYSFINETGSAPSDVELETPSGALITIQLTNSIIEDFDKQLTSTMLMESVQLNGTTIKLGDILILDYPRKSYRRVSKIRKARDGKIELLFRGKDYCLIENLGFKKFDINDLIICGMKVEPEKSYYIGSVMSTRSPIFRGKEARFSAITDNNLGRLVVMFQDLHSGSQISIPLSCFRDEKDELEFELFPKDSIERFGTFRIFNRLFRSKSEGSEYFIIRGRGVMHVGDTHLLKVDIETAKKDIVVNENEIAISSFDIDISYKVGDQVVIEDWNNPAEMVKVRTIDSFEIHPDNCLYISTKIDSGELRDEKYIDFSAGTIAIGKIRKIILEYNGLQAGDKIRANVSGLANFPKKDVNMIVGFIVDTETPYPLMLCSNCCTLWAAPSVLEQFNVYKRTTLSWRKYSIAPIEVQKIKFQSGDIVCSRSGNLHILHCAGDYTKFLMSDLQHNASFGYSYLTDRKVVGYQRYGIITPRYPLKQQIEQLQRRSCLPNLHGGFTKHDSSRMFFKEVWDNV